MNSFTCTFQGFHLDFRSNVWSSPSMLPPCTDSSPPPPLLNPLMPSILVRNPGVVSSAQIVILQITLSGGSLLYKRKSVGPGLQPQKNSSITWIFLQGLPIQINSKLSITKTRWNKVKYPTWKSLRLEFEKNHKTY